MHLLTPPPRTVNIAGFMIDNIANGTMKQWYLEDVDHLPRDGSAILLDVRTRTNTLGAIWKD